MSLDTSKPAVRVLAIASHVTHGYVGNKMATFVMQSLGFDVCAINTVNFSNHTAYRQFTGRKTPAVEIQEIYNGLKAATLNDFDMLVSGYVASKEAVETVGSIAQDLRQRSNLQPGSFFWVLDPVMGDNGNLYVSADIVPAYQALLPFADLILPNAFEAQVLTGIEIRDRRSLVAAVQRLHQQYGVPHVVFTSLRIPLQAGGRHDATEQLYVVGSSSTSEHQPRLFVIAVPALPIFFSGTGDLFAALIAVRLREAVAESSLHHLQQQSWLPADDVGACELPLAKATERVLASMHSVLTKTAARVRQQMSDAAAIDADTEEEKERRRHLLRTRASEVEVVRHVEDFRGTPPPSGDACFSAKVLQ